MIILLPCIHDTDLEIQVPTVENLAQSNVLHLRPGVGQNVAMHAAPIARNDKFNHSVLSFCVLIIVFVLSLLVLAVADGGVADAVNILHLSLSSFFLSAH